VIVSSWDAADESSTKGETMSQLQPIGNTTLVVADDEFAHAYQVGYLQYKLDYSTKTLSEMDIYTLYVGVITSVRHSGRYNAGYLTGWIAALLEGGEKTSVLVPALVAASTEEVQA